MEYVLPPEVHDRIVESAYRARGFLEDETRAAVRFSQLAAWHGIKTHNALKALHLDDHFGSGNRAHPGCVPGAKIERLPSRFKAAEKWNANRKLGQAVAFVVPFPGCKAHFRQLLLRHGSFYRLKNFVYVFLFT